MPSKRTTKHLADDDILNAASDTLASLDQDSSSTTPTTPANNVNNANAKTDEDEGSKTIVIHLPSKTMQAHRTPVKRDNTIVFPMKMHHLQLLTNVA